MIAVRSADFRGEVDWHGSCYSSSQEDEMNGYRMTRVVGYAVATVVSGALVSEVFTSRVLAEQFAQRLGRSAAYEAVEVRR